MPFWSVNPRTSPTLRPVIASSVSSAAVSEAGQARLVSVSHDVTGTRFAGGKGEVTSKIDRQTRTLLFMGADLVSEAGLHRHSTGIFRLDTD